MSDDEKTQVKTTSREADYKDSVMQDLYNDISSSDEDED